MTQFLASPAPMAELDLSWMLLFMGVLFAFHWILGLVCLVGAVLVVSLTLWTDRMTTSQVEAGTRTGAERSGFLEACRRNAEVVRALGRPMSRALSIHTLPLALISVIACFAPAVALAFRG